jgi:hypothetical protein
MQTPCSQRFGQAASTAGSPSLSTGEDRHHLPVAVIAPAFSLRDRSMPAAAPSP